MLKNPDFVTRRSAQQRSLEQEPSQHVDTCARQHGQGLSRLPRPSARPYSASRPHAIPSRSNRDSIPTGRLDPIPRPSLSIHPAAINRLRWLLLPLTAQPIQTPGVFGAAILRGRAAQLETCAWPEKECPHSATVTPPCQRRSFQGPRLAVDEHPRAVLPRKISRSATPPKVSSKYFSPHDQFLLEVSAPIREGRLR